MKLCLVDSDQSFASALADAFEMFPEITVSRGDLLEFAENTIVSPANSYGFMDGGIDADFRNLFGATLEEKVQDAIHRYPGQLLPVGAGLVVHTGNSRIPFLIVAPTMDSPEPIESENCYRAMRAILRVAAEHEEVGRKVYCPGLGTGVGQVSPEEAAGAMAQAYGDWKYAHEHKASN